MAKRAKNHESQLVSSSPLFYRLHAFLETIRILKTYEDPLCTLLHDLQKSGEAPAELERELEGLLDEMPSSSYTQELHAVRHTLHGTHPQTPSFVTPAPASAKPSARKRRRTA